MKVIAKINNNASVEFTPEEKTPLKGSIRSENFEIEMIQHNDKELLISRDGKKHIARLLAIDSESKTITIKIEMIQQNDTKLLISRDGKKHIARLLAIDSESKTITIKIDGDRFEVKLTDEYDVLLQSLGMDAASTKKVNELKAPMPGVVVDIVVGVGDSVMKDDPLVVLEAMKMENMLKSPSEGVIKSINIKKGDTVEKNRILVNFK